MFPLYDESHQRGKTPYLTIFLIIANVLIFFISLSNLDGFVLNFGFYPDRFFRHKDYFTIFSSMFLHGDFWHLFGNMWFLWVFGDNLERKLGSFKFLIFYLLCGIGSAVVYSFATADPSMPVIGASGAISGVLAGYLAFFPHNKIKALVPLFIFITTISIPAVIYIGVWFLYQLIYIGSDPFIAYWGHVGGFLTGFILAKLYQSFKG
jgi:membrane associated rhomboid family serine protease